MNKEIISAEQVGPRIRMLMSGLTEKEQLIMRDCLSLGPDINHYSITDIADRHGVSSAMIVKVAQHCGFSGFKEMKASLVDYAMLPSLDLHEELNPNDDTRTVVEKVFKTAISSLQETLAIFDFDAIEAAANAMRNATTIDLYGVGGSGTLAMDAYHKFLRVGIRTNVYTDSHMMVMSANLIKEGGVVLGFSHSGHTHAIIEAFSLAKKQSATTIAITNSPNSPLTDLADIVLCAVAQGSPISGESSAARIVQLNILDALFVLVAKDNYEQSLKNLEQTIHSVATLRA